MCCCQSDKPLDVSYSFRYFERVLSGFLDSLGIERISLVVHDLGGPIGLYKPIVMIRQRLLAAIDALERGETSPGLEAAAQRVRPATLYAPRDRTFDEVSEDILETRIGVPLTAV